MNRSRFLQALQGPFPLLCHFLDGFLLGCQFRSCGNIFPHFGAGLGPITEQIWIQLEGLESQGTIGLVEPRGLEERPPLLRVCRWQVGNGGAFFDEVRAHWYFEISTSLKILDVNHTSPICILVILEQLLWIDTDVDGLLQVCPILDGRSAVCLSLVWSDCPDQILPDVDDSLLHAGDIF